MKPSLIVGLTGGIGSGKSTVSDIFQKLGVEVIDADSISHELTATGQPGYTGILKLFGQQVLNEKKELRRDYIRKLIFNDHELKMALEGIIHPLVREEIVRRIDNISYPYCLISIPLLFESKSDINLDRILVVDLPEELQVERASRRDGVDEEDIEKIMQAQVPRQKRIELADDIITNDSGLESLAKQVNSLHEKYLQIAKQ